VGLATACRPEIEGRPSIIQEPRVLAIQSFPAEAAEDARVTYQALYVGPLDKPVDETDLGWANCTLRKPLSTAGAINPACLAKSGDGIEAIGNGVSAETAIATEACRMFGPSQPPAETGKPAVRAADPDTTGGYYQPVTVRFPSQGLSDFAAGVTRLACGIGAAPQAEVIEYNKSYRPNANPEITAINALIKTQKTSLLNSIAPDAMIQIPPGKTLSLEAVWPEDCGACNDDGVCDANENLDSCPTDCPDKVGCGSAEQYVTFDPASRTLAKKSEQIRMSWFATAGDFEHERTGSNSSHNDYTSENTWTAPDSPGQVSFWVVIRDDRRGVGWKPFQLMVGN